MRSAVSVVGNTNVIPVGSENEVPNFFKMFNICSRNKVYAKFVHSQ